MEITFTTPALLFPAISLLLVAYTNRFNALSSRIRDLHSRYKAEPDGTLVEQIESLRKRIYLIRSMQGAGVASLFLSVLCMFALFAGEAMLGKAIFAVSLLLMLASLAFSLQETFLSVHALKLELRELQGKKKGG